MSMLSKFNCGRIPHGRILNHPEFYAIIHFGPNSFLDREWGYGDESPGVFNPKDFDADRLTAICRECGMEGVILVCKHHDGFCLWPTATTPHNISNSPWRNGHGDMVREFSESCRRSGLKFGVYVSPWDRHSAMYGRAEYPPLFRRQLTELLTNYGELFEVWFDGANGGDGFYGGARECRAIDRTNYYDWDAVWSLVRELQPNAAIFSDAGPDLRWVGNEMGLADGESFGTYTPHAPDPDMEPAPGFTVYPEGEKGHADGLFYMPPECDVPLRPGWFYHPGEDSRCKSPSRLLDIYLSSVGCGGFLNLGLAPAPNGRLAPGDIARLREFRLARKALFAAPVAQETVPVQNGEAQLEFKCESGFNLVELAEPEREEKVRSYEVLLRRDDGGFQSLFSGQAIGRRRLKKLPRPVCGNALKIRIKDASEAVARLKIGCYSAIFPEAPPLRPVPPLRRLPCGNGAEWLGDLGSAAELAGFVFTPDPELPPGTPDHYEFQVSDDGKVWRLAASGEFANLRANPVPQVVQFARPECARFCRLRPTRMLVPGTELAGIGWGVLPR